MREDLAERLRHRHERRRGEDEDAEERKEGEEHSGHDGTQGRRDGSCRDPARDPGAGGEGVESVAGGRRPLHEVPQARRREKEREAADQQAAVGDVILRMAQGAPPDREQEQRHGNVECPEEVRRHRSEAGSEPPVHAEPHRSGDDHGQRDEEQAQAVTAVDVVEVPRAVADATCCSTDRVGQSEP